VKGLTFYRSLLEFFLGLPYYFRFRGVSVSPGHHSCTISPRRVHLHAHHTYTLHHIPTFRGKRIWQATPLPIISQ
jgi:hypothetical protein